MTLEGRVERGRDEDRRRSTGGQMMRETSKIGGKENEKDKGKGSKSSESKIRIR